MNGLSFICSRTWLGALLLSLGLLMGASAVCAQSTLADGQVIKIDQAAGTITIKHGPLKQFGMDEGMTMVYRAADPAMLNTMKPGDKVKFAPGRTICNFFQKLRSDRKGALMSQRESGYQRKLLDQYETPAWVARALIPHLPKFTGKIWEPACGGGKMAATL